MTISVLHHYILMMEPVCIFISKYKSILTSESNSRPKLPLFLDSHITQFRNSTKNNKQSTSIPILFFPRYWSREEDKTAGGAEIWVGKTV